MASEFQKREERKRQNSAAGDSPWPGVSASPGPGTGRVPPTRANTIVGDGWNSSGSSSGWSSASGAYARTSGRTTSASFSASGSTSRPKGPQRHPSINTGSYAPPVTEAERQRKVEEENRERQERFRLEQEQKSREQQAKIARGSLSVHDMIQIYAYHETQWVNISNRDLDLRWDKFPWPMFSTPSNPEAINSGAILAYLSAECYPDKMRLFKDRIKDQIKKWHPDRFETKLLPKVAEGERELVKLGAGEVVRYLNDLMALP